MVATPVIKYEGPGNMRAFWIAQGEKLFDKVNMLQKGMDNKCMNFHYPDGGYIKVISIGNQILDNKLDIVKIWMPEKPLPVMRKKRILLTDKPIAVFELTKTPNIYNEYIAEAFGITEDFSDISIQVIEQPFLAFDSVPEYYEAGEEKPSEWDTTRIINDLYPGQEIELEPLDEFLYRDSTIISDRPADVPFQHLVSYVEYSIKYSDRITLHVVITQTGYLQSDFTAWGSVPPYDIVHIQTTTTEIVVDGISIKKGKQIVTTTARPIVKEVGQLTGIAGNYTEQIDQVGDVYFLEDFVRTCKGNNIYGFIYMHKINNGVSSFFSAATGITVYSGTANHKLYYAASGKDYLVCEATENGQPFDFSISVYMNRIYNYGSDKIPDPVYVYGIRKFYADSNRDRAIYGMIYNDEHTQTEEYIFVDPFIGEDIHIIPKVQDDGYFGFGFIRAARMKTIDIGIGQIMPETEIPIE